ncbi:hypothetical protein [Anaeromyxobacter oryzae]|uniref:Uncharacterized protein n=1 Tax=Anaeromyxobacter oryzae TaxID=2918170 RepID=A0ABM7X296_9BACT|nr:hypothetical protein [Anaeromyxobacter oryzae]BDG05911.1 hypothetical protein AMOR_49070 [Anaeromyxobacter oryzae]
MRGARRLGFVAAVAAGMGLPARAAGPCLLEARGFSRQRCVTAECLSCHDGSAAPIRTGHPVDVAYGASWLARRAALRAAPAPGLVLTDGRLTCATCHDGGSREPHHLASPPGAAGLCGGCHAK